MSVENFFIARASAASTYAAPPVRGRGRPPKTARPSLAVARPRDLAFPFGITATAASHNTERQFGFRRFLSLLAAAEVEGRADVRLRLLDEALAALHERDMTVGAVLAQTRPAVR